VGAVYGGLAGAYYGLDGIPHDWLESLQKKDVVMKIAADLANLAKQYE
jgi:ADP-ribosyl-[dinitrogen reductase] hydrolase